MTALTPCHCHRLSSCDLPRYRRLLPGAETFVLACGDRDHRDKASCVVTWPVVYWTEAVDRRRRRPYLGCCSGGDGWMAPVTVDLALSADARVLYRMERLILLAPVSGERWPVLGCCRIW